MDKGGRILLEWGQFITLSMIAIALSMDAFSLGLGLGMKRLLHRQMFFLSVTIGILHVLMPLVGMVIGQYLGVMMQEVAVMIGGGILCFLGGKMIFQKSDGTVRIHSLTQLFLLSTSVSLDSLSVGLTLGLFSTDPWIAVSIFGCVGVMMSGAGLWMGKFAGSWLGNAGETIGGLILILLGLKFIW